MAHNLKIQQIKISELNLDIKNPRFAELYSGSDKEEDLINYLLYNEAASDIAKGIINSDGFYPDRPLWVIKNDGQFIVKDGNRRCAAVKALQLPSKYGLSLSKFELLTLPVLIYKEESKLNSRILEEHTSSLFKQWDRIAKALEVYKLFTNSVSIDSMKEVDSQPLQLIRLASFYYEAVKISGEDLKKLLRRGRGATGGKTIIFERLFKYSKKCGYYFQNKPNYVIKITDPIRFKEYISSLVSFLKVNSKIRAQDIDNQKEGFFTKLKPYGFELNPTVQPVTNTPAIGSNPNAAQPVNPGTTSAPQPINPGTTSAPQPGNTPAPTTSTPTPPSTPIPIPFPPPPSRGSVKTKPTFKRKKVPAALNTLIKECFNIKANDYPNSKTALSRVTFECVLKYVCENTRFNRNNTVLTKSNYFSNVFFDSKGNKKTYTDFKVLKDKFQKLIKDTGIRKAMETFDLELSHQIIHNYHVAASPQNATILCGNLIPLIEFLLQEETLLLNSLDRTKL